ncbi:hypothetical protein [uncultured Tateyamaria sp.]|uniref:hypothetical protein n=1 Tax=uncultured Tateyamaria sp. TaxID=455651 RepID=UPI00344E69CF
MPLCDLMTHWPETISAFNRPKMLCVGCLISSFHKIRDCCREYDLDEAAFLVELTCATIVG